MGMPLLLGAGFEYIDPMAFDDPATGKRLLYWGSGFQPIKVQELSEDRLSFARETIDEVVARANGECAQDSECALVFIDTQCQGACQAAILSANLDEFGRAKHAIDERACTGYQEDGCSFSTPRCMQMRAICAESRCTMTPVTESAAG